MTGLNGLHERKESDMKAIACTTAVLIAITGSLASPALSQGQPAPLIGVTRAVAAAERALPGHALEAELESRRGRLMYEIELLSGDQLHEVLIDARSGRTIAKDRIRAESLWRKWFDSDWGTTVKSAGRLAPRLAALERQANGKVREVGFDVERGVPVYEVEIAGSAGITEVHIDARTGKRLTMEFDD
jgi:uncharacterized membrane protein YkoI